MATELPEDVDKDFYDLFSRCMKHYSSQAGPERAPGDPTEPPLGEPPTATASRLPKKDRRDPRARVRPRLWTWPMPPCPTSATPA